MARIDLAKVREWTVEFILQQPLSLFPVPARIVMERESAGYRIPASPLPPGCRLGGGQLTVTLSGEGRFRAGSFHCALKPGSAFLYRIADPAVSYHYPPGGDAPWCFLWMHFDGDAAEALIAELNRKYGYVFDLSGSDELVELMLRYRRSAGKAYFLSPLEGAKLALDVFELLCRGLERREALEPAAKLAIQVQKLVAENPAGVPTGELARQLAVSREHLCKIFKEKNHQTLHAYRTARRLDAAEELLRKTTLSCKEIMHRCGFGSYSSFYRAFFRRRRQSPEIFRGGRPPPGNPTEM